MVEKRTTGYLFQDVGIFLLLGTILASTLVVANVSEGLFMESMVMMLAIFIAMLFAAFKMAIIEASVVLPKPGGP